MGQLYYLRSNMNYYFPIHRVIPDLQAQGPAILFSGISYTSFNASVHGFRLISFGYKSLGKSLFFGIVKILLSILPVIENTDYIAGLGPFLFRSDN